MTVFGFHASHEQIHPRRAAGGGDPRRAGRLRRRHVARTTSRRGAPGRAQSGFAWSWLGAALQATNLPFGVVNAPGQRYHPAIIAQAIGTLGAMYPGRFWAALGTGEASNEHITGDGWPRKDVRTARLRECVDVIRALLAGEEVSHDGLVRVDRARLWTRPEQPPALIGAAVSVATARWCAEWADGLITVNAPVDAPAPDDRRVPGRRRARAAAPPGARRAGRRTRPRPRRSRTTSGAATSSPRRSAGTWRRPSTSTWSPRDVPLEQVAEVVNVSADLGRHVGWLEEYVELGFDQIALHHVGQEQRAFIDAFGAEVLPKLRTAG